MSQQRRIFKIFLRGLSIIYGFADVVATVYARQQNALRVLAIVEVSVCLSVRHTAVSCQNGAS